VTLPIGLRVHSGRFHNVIVLAEQIHILNSINTWVVIGKEIQSTVSDAFKVLLLPDSPPLKLPFELLEACFHSQEASWIWVPCHGIIIRYLPDMTDHILGWRWEDVIQRKVAAATTHRCLGARCGVGLLAMVNDSKKHWVVQFHHGRYPSSSCIVICLWSPANLCLGRL